MEAQGGCKVKDKLILLVGPSGSGKTTIAKELEKEGYNVIHSYTTRPPREPDEWGHTFVNDVALEELYDKQDTIVAFQMLYGNAYWATKEQYQGKGTSIYVIDPKGAEQVKESVKDAEVVTIYLQCGKFERWDRMMYRAGLNKTVFSAEQMKEHRERALAIQTRIENDDKMFSIVKCDHIVDANRNIEEVLTDVKSVIEQQFSQSR
ncbi:MAG TPA: AAA family ATPase [Clostridiaceae bacterium]|nr:AAA family ATPase [Clostridiaceae bacterium]